MEVARIALGQVEGGQTPDAETLLALLSNAEALLAREPQLLELRVRRAVIVGDTHGDLESTLKVVKRYPPGRNVLVFLGDYVDRGESSLENASYLLALKLLYPRSVYLLRGNHESMVVNQAYGFYFELAKKARGRSFELFVRFNEVLSGLPYAALLKPQKLMLVHGGVPTTMPSLRQLKRLPKKDLVPTNPTAFQLLWNDPGDVEGFGPSERGEGAYVYGRGPVEAFLRRNGLAGIVRSHEAVEEGYRFSFPTGPRKGLLSRRVGGMEGLVLTVFTSGAYENVKPAVAVVEGKQLRVTYV